MKIIDVLKKPHMTKKFDLLSEKINQVATVQKISISEAEIVVCDEISEKMSMAFKKKQLNENNDEIEIKFKEYAVINNIIQYENIDLLINLIMKQIKSVKKAKLDDILYPEITTKRLIYTNNSADARIIGLLRSQGVSCINTTRKLKKA